MPHQTTNDRRPNTRSKNTAARQVYGQVQRACGALRQAPAKQQYKSVVHSKHCSHTSQPLRHHQRLRLKLQLLRMRCGQGAPSPATRLSSGTSCHTSTDTARTRHMPQHWLATLTTPRAHHAARLLHTCTLREASQPTAGCPAPPAGLPHTYVSTHHPGATHSPPPTTTSPHHTTSHHTTPPPTCQPHRPGTGVTGPARPLANHQPR